MIWKYKEIFPSLPSAFLVLGLRHVPQCWYSSLLCFAVRNTTIENNWQRGFVLFCFCLLIYTSQSQCIVEGSQGKNWSVAGTWRRELKQRPWGSPLAALLHVARSAWGHLPGVVPPTVGWLLLYQSLIRKTHYKLFLQHNLMDGSFSIDFLFFPSDHVTLTWVKLAKNCQYN